MDPYLLYGLLALGGWLLRHFGVGANLQLPFGPSPAPAKVAEVKQPSVVYMPQPNATVADHKQVLADAMTTVKKSLDAKAAAEFEALLAQAKPQ